MEYANNLRHEISLLKSRVAEAIETNLKRIGKDHSADDGEDGLIFFGFATTVENDITAIKADGTLIRYGTEDASIRGAIEDDIVSLDDAMCLLEGLEEI